MEREREIEIDIEIERLDYGQWCKQVENERVLSWSDLTSLGYLERQSLRSQDTYNFDNVDLHVVNWG